MKDRNYHNFIRDKLYQHLLNNVKDGLVVRECFGQLESKDGYRSRIADVAVFRQNDYTSLEHESAVAFEIKTSCPGKVEKFKDYKKLDMDVVLVTNKDNYEADKKYIGNLSYDYGLDVVLYDNRSGSLIDMYRDNETDVYQLDLDFTLMPRKDVREKRRHVIVQYLVKNDIKHFKTTLLYEEFEDMTKQGIRYSLKNNKYIKLASKGSRTKASEWKFIGEKKD